MVRFSLSCGGENQDLPPFVESGVLPLSAADFFRFRDRCVRQGIEVPIVPGLLPITNFSQIQRITALCGAKLPGELVKGLEAAGENDEAQAALGVDFAIRQTQQLLDGGVPGIHFYVLNRSEATSRVLDQVSLPRGI